MDIEDAKKFANNKSSWRERLQAVYALKGMTCKQSEDILVRLALHDPVFKVKEAAFRAAQSRNIKYKGQPIRLTKKPRGALVKGIDKKLLYVANKFVGDFELEEFKQKFKAMYPIEFDLYEGDQEKQFDKWLSKKLSVIKK